MVNVLARSRLWIERLGLRTFGRKFFTTWIFLKFLLQSDSELLVPEMQKKWGSPSSFQI